MGTPPNRPNWAGVYVKMDKIEGVERKTKEGRGKKGDGEKERGGDT